jgi:hypothetical protein
MRCTLCEMHVYEVHTHEMHAREVHAHEMHAYEVHASKVHAHDLRTYKFTGISFRPSASDHDLRLYYAFNGYSPCKMVAAKGT